MSKILKPIVIAAFLASLLLVASPAEAQRRGPRGRYWNNYWRWYDNDYRPYYSRRYRNWNRDRYYDGGYRYDYGNRYDYGRNRSRYWYGRPYSSGIQIGPLGIGWR